MSYTELARTRPVPSAWENLTDEQNDAQTAAIYAVIAKNGGDVKGITYSPSRIALTSVVEYPTSRDRRRVGPDVWNRH